jgi:hypothetical protein
MRTITISTLIFPPAISAPTFAETTQQATGSAEPAGFILFVLGLVALLIGARNLRVLRTKRMAPPRPRRTSEDQKTPPQHPKN